MSLTEREWLGCHISRLELINCRYLHALCLPNVLSLRRRRCHNCLHIRTKLLTDKQQIILPGFGKQTKAASNAFALSALALWPRVALGCWWNRHEAGCDVAKHLPVGVLARNFHGSCVQCYPAPADGAVTMPWARSTSLLTSVFSPAELWSLFLVRNQLFVVNGITAYCLASFGDRCWCVRVWGTVFQGSVPRATSWLWFVKQCRVVHSNSSNRKTSLF